MTTRIWAGTLCQALWCCTHLEVGFAAKQMWFHQVEPQEIDTVLHVIGRLEGDQVTRVTNASLQKLPLNISSVAFSLCFQLIPSLS